MTRTAALGVVLATALVATEVRADDTSELEGMLDESVVSGPSKSAEVASAAPATSTTITAEDLRRYGIHSLDEAINFLSLGMITENPLGAVEIGARGVLLTQDYGSHVLVVINGHSVNEQWGGSAYFDRGAGIPMELVDHIEVILGPGSVLYGSNAMLGVINIVTKRAKDYDGLHAVAESELPTSIRGAVGMGKEFELFGAKGELTFQAEYYAQHGPTFSFGPQDYGTDGVTGNPRIFSRDAPPGVWGGQADDAYYTRVPSAYARVFLGNFEVNARTALYERSYPYLGGNFDDPDDREVDRWVSLDIKHRATISPVVEMTTRVYGDSYDYRQYYTSNAAEDCLEGQDSGCLYYLVGVARWAGAELQGSFDWLRDKRLVTMIGVDGRLKYIFSKVDITDNATGDNPGSIGVYSQVEKAIAAYLQQTAQPATWFGLSGGIRIDVDDRFGSHLSPRAALTVSPWKASALKVIYAEAFRAPTAFDIYYSDPTSQVPAPDLLPETVRSVEASVEQRVGTQRVLFGVFRTWFNDLVLTQDLSAEEVQAAKDRGQLEATIDSAEQTRNLSSIDSYGFDAAYDGSVLSGKLRYGAGLTAGYARRNDPDAEPAGLPAAPGVFGNARVSYELPAGWPTMALAGRAEARRLAEGSGYAHVPYAPPLAELRATLAGPFPGLHGLSYRVSANYSFAARSPYAVGPGLPADGDAELAPIDRFRTTVGLSYDFSPWSTRAR